MEQYLGTILLSALSFVPQDFLVCNGQLLSISANQALFSLLGKRYGGDGINNFALPLLPALPGLTFIICVNGQWPVQP